MSGQLGAPTAQANFVEGRFLAGFMEDAQIETVAVEMVAGFKQDQRREFWKSVASARQFADRLPSEELTQGVVEPLPPDAAEYVDGLTKDPGVSSPFAGQGWKLSFGLVDLSRVVCLQGVVLDSDEVPPRDPASLTRYALPPPAQVPCDVTIGFDKPPNLPPPITGHATFLGDVPYLNSLTIAVSNGQLSFGSPSHINFVQVAEFEGRFYLRNGYHRATVLGRQGVTRTPAAVVSGLPPNFQMGGPDMMQLERLAPLRRPPLIQDFFGDAALPIRRRKKRTGMMLRFEATPFQVPV